MLGRKSIQEHEYFFDLLVFDRVSCTPDWPWTPTQGLVSARQTLYLLSYIPALGEASSNLHTHLHTQFYRGGKRGAGKGSGWLGF